MSVANLPAAVITPMWQRIAKGEVDLSEYTDEEILTGHITMEDGRLLPTPHVLPRIFVEEQRRRAMLVSEKAVREGSVAALEVYREILDDITLPARERMVAAKFFTDRFLGPAEQHIHITGGEGEDPRDILLQRLLAAKHQEDEDAEANTIDVEIVDEELEDLL